jgi:hypothetical protein
MNKLKSPDIKLNKPFIIKQKKCKSCKELFTPRNSLQSVCGFECSVTHTLKLKEKRELNEDKARRKQHREALTKLKSRSTWLKEAQLVFNRYIRLRDQHELCISCGRDHQGQYHSGHYLSVGSHPELRFEELNVHKQCAPCNNHLSGNIVLYRQRLLRKIGQQAVEWLEGKHEPKKYTIDEIQSLMAYYRKRIKELEAT